MMFGHLLGWYTIYIYMYIYSGAFAAGRPSRWALAHIVVVTFVVTVVHFRFLSVTYRQLLLMLDVT